MGDGFLVLNSFAPADRAQPGDLTFAENESYFARAEQSAASAILVDGKFKSAGKVLICVPNARIAFAKILPLFFPQASFKHNNILGKIFKPFGQEVKMILPLGQ